MNENTTELYEKFVRMQRLFHKQHLRDHVNRGPMSDPSRGQGRILALLKMQDGVSTKDLSYLLGIRVSSLNELLVKLEKNDYITRTPAEEDRRVILVQLTEKGRNEEQKSQAKKVNYFSCLTEDEQKILGEYLDRIIASWEAEFSNDLNEEEIASWREKARERMGEEVFERLASLHRCGFHHHPLGKFHHRHNSVRHGEMPSRPKCHCDTE